MMNRPRHILPVIVLSQFAGTSLWFVGNAVLPELKASLGLSSYAVSNITTAVMLGFVSGSLVFALLTLPDRYSPVRLFFLSTIAAALANVSVVWIASDAFSLYGLRFLTGFFMAGVYPVGMKIASDWYEKGLGKALGWLVGALVLGTAFPHLLKNREFAWPWKTVLYCTSLIAVVGGFLMLFLVGDGPFRKKIGRFRLDAIKKIFSSKKWRLAAFGYFGHMWELYSFWGFVPVMLSAYSLSKGLNLDISFLSFIIIGIGSASCVAGGLLSQRMGSARIAFICLLISGCCCFLSPLFFKLSFPLYFGLLLVWGITSCADSPQFSTLVSQYAPEELRGTALTIYNAIGFLITTISLVIIDRVVYSNSFFKNENAFILLGLGAVFGLPGMVRLIRRNLG
jgi:MFS family permease